jgi:hypothetical protein
MLRAGNGDVSAPYSQTMRFHSSVLFLVHASLLYDEVCTWLKIKCSVVTLFAGPQ